MNNLKKTIFGIFTVCVFALMMMFSVTTTDLGFDLNLCGETVLANGGCQEAGGGATPKFLNYTGDPGHSLNCNHAGNGCIPCTSTPIE